MADREDIRDGVKTIIGRQASGVDTAINEYIDIANELISNTVTSIYDEAIYTHVISQVEVDADTESYVLPTGTGRIISASYVDKSQTEDVFHELRIISPGDEGKPLKYGFGREGQTGAAGSSFDFSTQPRTFLPTSHRSNTSHTRVNQDGQPEMAYVVGKNLYVFPRPGNDEVNDEIRLIVTRRPDLLTTDSSTNTITDNYPEALTVLAAGLFYSGYFKDISNGGFFIQQAGSLVASFANKDEANKFQNITLGFSRV